jgi:chemotaxis response regulator CheB
VVASEVRKLAQRSQAAAAEIGTLSADTVKGRAGSDCFARRPSANALGIIMTGMGDDGARSMLEMRTA